MFQSWTVPSRDSVGCFTRYYLEFSRQPTDREIELLFDLLDFSLTDLVDIDEKSGKYLEIGPRPGWKTPWSTHVQTMLHHVVECQGLLNRIEKSLLWPRAVDGFELDTENLPRKYLDPMVEMVYPQPLTSFNRVASPEQVQLVAQADLENFNREHQLGFDQFELDYYQRFYREDKPYLTDVELYDLAQSNSEHSRHWLFRGRLTLKEDPEKALSETLFDMIKRPLKANARNSLVAMRDNSSVIRGYSVPYLQLFSTDMSTHVHIYVSDELKLQKQDQLLHPLLTAETHNFPTGIAPFPGAATGTGGRIRDVQATGRGGLMMAGTAGYAVGDIDNNNNNNNNEWQYPGPTPKQILIEASNGASDYGNKMGEPVVAGFARSFGLKLLTHSGKERRVEYVKPIMFSAGLGQIMDAHLEKEDPETGWLIVRLGGPAYRIGVGGGAASSRAQGASSDGDGGNKCNRDQQAVQREDPEMENKLNRVIRTCIEMGLANPIRSIHDQGAGGMGNVTKEIVSPLGALVSLDAVVSGDSSLSAREKWIAEYQEQNTVLIHPKDAGIMKRLALRENLPIAFVGVVAENGRIQVYQRGDRGNNGNNRSGGYSEIDDCHSFPVDLDLQECLVDIPQKTFEMSNSNANQVAPQPIEISNEDGGEDIDMSTGMAGLLEKVFSLVSVGSKRFLVNKVDRSVGGLTVQQQTVGPFQTPIADYALMAQSPYGKTAIATSIGEQPIKGLLDPAKMARLAVGEMLTNLVFVGISSFEDIKCSGNWMWDKSQPDEVYALYQAVKSLSECLETLGIAIDGGKDSLSMSAWCGKEKVSSPRTLVMSSYVTCPDLELRVTPEFKQPGNRILLIELGADGGYDLGGSALAQVLGGVGAVVPDLQDPLDFKFAFETVQILIKNRLIEAGHDRSDGGLITTIAEMSMASPYGCQLKLPAGFGEYGADLMSYLFAEELGLVIEVQPERVPLIMACFNGEAHCIPVYDLGEVTKTSQIRVISHNEQTVLDIPVSQARNWWERTSFRLEQEQTAVECLEQEYKMLSQSPHPPISREIFCPELCELMQQPQWRGGKYKVAILREEGSNGDREMAAAFELTGGFRVYDVTMTDLVQGRASLDEFDGLAVVGGFSYADTLGAGRGWAWTVRNNPNLWEQFERFRQNPRCFSLGICNGCQLMSELGWVPVKMGANKSGRFESRYLNVRIAKSSSIMLKDMHDSCLGVWIAHAEGNMELTSEAHSVQQAVYYQGDSVLPWVDAGYPANPNGSAKNLAAVCSTDGRHLAMMPHPERTVMSWQPAWISPEAKEQLLRAGYDERFYPWMEMFRNAYRWLEQLD